jgi:hypothetical protein
MNPTYQSGFYAPGRGTAKYPALWDGCVGAWNPGLGNTGLSLRDWSGNQNNGVLTNGPTWGVSGGRQALSFDGVNDYVGLSTFSGLPTIEGDQTMSLWTQHDGTASRRMIFTTAKDGTTTGNNSLGIELNIGMLAATGWGGVAYNRISLSLVPANTWFLATLTQVGGVPTMWLNIYPGTFNATRTQAGSTGSVRIGSFNASFPDPYHNRPISDVRVYNRVLSPQEIRLLAQRPGIAYERAPRKFYSLPSATGNPTGILQNNLQSMRLGL